MKRGEPRPRDKGRPGVLNALMVTLTAAGRPLAVDLTYMPTYTTCSTYMCSRIWRVVSRL